MKGDSGLSRTLLSDFRICSTMGRQKNTREFRKLPMTLNRWKEQLVKEFQNIRPLISLVKRPGRANY